MTLSETIQFWIEQFTRFVSPQWVATEWVLCGLVALSIALSISFPGLRWWKWLSGAGRAVNGLAERRGAAIVVCGVLPVALRLALLGVWPVPEPSIHDEFSHLLLADTLAHGRLSNPTHPLWQHFESIHIIQQPTYSSMYPPAQGMFLALGEVLFHEPWAGVVLSVGLMFAAMCWMMQQWMPIGWAFYGTLIAIARIGIFGPWINSYLGGPVSALGGALLIGALPSLREAGPPLREPGARAIHSVLFGLGLVILMNSRPFEGAFLGLAALIYILPAVARRIRAGGWLASRPIWAPALILVACGFVFSGFYSWRVTGSPLRMPYVVNRDTYGWPENLAFLPERSLSFRHDVLKNMYAVEVQRLEIFKKWDSFVNDIDGRVFANWSFFIGPLLTLPLLAAMGNFRQARTRPLLLFIGMIGCLNLFQLVLYPYHLGPVVAILFALAAQGLWRIYKLLSGIRPAAGYAMALTLPACLLFAGAIKQQATQLSLPLTYWELAQEPHGVPRASIAHWLAGRPRKQLVIVRYGPTHSPNQEWVYNGADIDGSKVVWAREMDDQADARLLQYFKDREVWLLQADVLPQHVVPYPHAEDTGTAGDPWGGCKCEPIRK